MRLDVRIATTHHSWWEKNWPRLRYRQAKTWGFSHNWPKKIWLVLGHPSEEYESQLGWLFPIYGKIKNVPNHQPDIGGCGKNQQSLDSRFSASCFHVVSPSYSVFSYFSEKLTSKQQLIDLESLAMEHQLIQTLDMKNHEWPFEYNDGLYLQLATEPSLNKASMIGPSPAGDLHRPLACVVKAKKPGSWQTPDVPWSRIGQIWR